MVTSHSRLERLLRRAGRELAEHQVARLYKIPEEMSVTPCDFFGFTASGRIIMVEAKAVQRASLPLTTSPGLLPHQFASLNECNNANGIAVVCWARGDECASLSWDMVLELSEGRRSIPWHRIEPRFIRVLTEQEVHLRLLDTWLPVG